MDGSLDTHLVTMTASGSANIAIPLFVYQSEVVNPLTSLNGMLAFFTNIASPLDMQDLPVGVPLDAQANTMFRLSTLRVYTRSQKEAEFVRDEVRADVRALVSRCKALNSWISTPSSENIG